MSRALATVRGEIGADGTLDLTLGPVPVGRRWSVDLLALRLSTGEGTADVYFGNPSAGDILDGTYDAARDSTGRVGDLDQNEFLTVRFAGATVAAIASVNLRGTEHNAGR